MIMRILFFLCVGIFLEAQVFAMHEAGRLPALTHSVVLLKSHDKNVILGNVRSLQPHNNAHCVAYAAEQLSDLLVPSGTHFKKSLDLRKLLPASESMVAGIADDDSLCDWSKPDTRHFLASYLPHVQFTWIHGWQGVAAENPSHLKARGDVAAESAEKSVAPSTKTSIYCPDPFPINPTDSSSYQHFCAIVSRSIINFWDKVEEEKGAGSVLTGVLVGLGRNVIHPEKPGEFCGIGHMVSLLTPSFHVPLQPGSAPSATLLPLTGSVFVNTDGFAYGAPYGSYLTYIFGTLPPPYDKKDDLTVAEAFYRRLGNVVQGQSDPDLCEQILSPRIKLSGGREWFLRDFAAIVTRHPESRHAR